MALACFGVLVKLVGVRFLVGVGFFIAVFGCVLVFGFVCVCLWVGFVVDVFVDGGLLVVFFVGGVFVGGVFVVGGFVGGVLWCFCWWIFVGGFCWWIFVDGFY